VWYVHFLGNIFKALSRCSLLIGPATVPSRLWRDDNGSASLHRYPVEPHQRFLACFRVSLLMDAGHSLMVCLWEPMASGRMFAYAGYVAINHSVAAMIRSDLRITAPARFSISFSSRVFFFGNLSVAKVPPEWRIGVGSRVQARQRCYRLSQHKRLFYLFLRNDKEIFICLLR
jgi:hypothetical protein